MILEVMGRDAGHIAISAGIAGGVDVILIPEIPYTVASICQKIKERQDQGKNYSLEPIPLTSETKYRNKLREGKHQNILSGVPIEQRVFYTCVETRRKSAPADTWVQFP
jgi:6-phosphofructokinase